MNIYSIIQLISGIIFGTLTLASLINAMIGVAMGAIIAMAVADLTIAYAEKNSKKVNKS